MQLFLQTKSYCNNKVPKSKSEYNTKRMYLQPQNVFIDYLMRIYNKNVTIVQVFEQN